MYKLQSIRTIFARIIFILVLIFAHTGYSNENSISISGARILMFLSSDLIVSDDIKFKSDVIQFALQLEKSGLATYAATHKEDFDKVVINRAKFLEALQSPFPQEIRVTGTDLKSVLEGKKQPSVFFFPSKVVGIRYNNINYILLKDEKRFDKIPSSKWVETKEEIKSGWQRNFTSQDKALTLFIEQLN